MPRAALLSIHARVAGTTPTTWEYPSLVQIWGPRYNVFVVAERDLAVFSLGVLPDDAKGRRKAIETRGAPPRVPGRAADGIRGGRPWPGRDPNSLRYGAASGRILIRWEGARQPTVWTVSAPTIDPSVARLELARRYLHVYGPTTPTSFARWASLAPSSGTAAFEALRRSVIPVRTPVGEGGSSRVTNPRCARTRDRSRRLACCRAATRSICCTVKTGPARARRASPVGPVDLACLARGAPGRRRGRRHLASRERGGDDRAVAPADARATGRRRGRGDDVAPARLTRSHRRALGSMRGRWTAKACWCSFGSTRSRTSGSSRRLRLSPSEEFRGPAPLDHGTAFDTLRHLVDVDWSWREFCIGNDVGETYAWEHGFSWTTLRASGRSPSRRTPAYMDTLQDRRRRACGAAAIGRDDLRAEMADHRAHREPRDPAPQ